MAILMARFIPLRNIASLLTGLSLPGTDDDSVRIYLIGVGMGSFLVGGRNVHSSHVLSSLHLAQTFPDLISAIVRPVASKRASTVCVIGLRLNHASLRKVALPL